MHEVPALFVILHNFSYSDYLSKIFGCKGITVSREVRYLGMLSSVSHICVIYGTFLRKMSTEEKRKLGAGLSQLSPEDLNRALEIIAQNNPSFQATAEEVDLDMDALVINLSC